jgi:hypothetical protein
LNVVLFEQTFLVHIQTVSYFSLFVIALVIIKPTTFDEQGQKGQIQAVAECGSS